MTFLWRIVASWKYIRFWTRVYSLFFCLFFIPNNLIGNITSPLRLSPLFTILFPHHLHSMPTFRGFFWFGGVVRCSLLQWGSSWSGLWALLQWESCPGGAEEGRRKPSIPQCTSSRCLMPATAPRLMGCSTTFATTSSMPPTKGTSGELTSLGKGSPPVLILGEMYQAGSGGLASLFHCHVPSLPGKIEFQVVFKATAAKITFSPHSMSPWGGGGRKGCFSFSGIGRSHYLWWPASTSSCSCLEHP